MCTNLAYEEEFWEELIDGKAVLMSPRPATNHNQTAFNIASIFKNFLKGKPCRVFPDGTDLYLTDKDRFIPDVMVICDRSKVRDDGIHGAPDLVVEVLSPSSIKRDRVYKKRVYEQCGVREYWIVNPMDKSVEVYLLENGVYHLDEAYCLAPDYWLNKLNDEERAELKTEIVPSIFSGLTVALEDVFENVP